MILVFYTCCWIPQQILTIFFHYQAITKKLCSRSPSCILGSLLVKHVSSLQFSHYFRGNIVYPNRQTNFCKGPRASCARNKIRVQSQHLYILSNLVPFPTRLNSQAPEGFGLLNRRGAGTEKTKQHRCCNQASRNFFRSFYRQHPILVLIVPTNDLQTVMFFLFFSSANIKNRLQSVNNLLGILGWRLVGRAFAW